MMSMESIRSMSNKAAREAARRKKRPYVPYDEAEVEGWSSFPFPFLGSYSPPDWQEVESLFCDSSGFGGDDEPALSVRQLKAKVKEYLAKDGTFGFAVGEQGQFQAYVKVFEYKGTKPLRRARMRAV